MSNINLYRHALSGHSHRVELFLSLLGVKARLVDVDLLSGEHKQPEFLSRNAYGQVPVLEDGAHVIADSNAILVYLAQAFDPKGNWYPSEPALAADVQRYLSLAAGPIASGPAAARLVTVFGAGLDHDKAKQVAEGVLTTLDAHLAGRDWLVGETPTIADVANYAYIAHAPEGEVSLSGYVNIRNWLARIEALPGFVPMQITAVGLAA